MVNEAAPPWATRRWCWPRWSASGSTDDVMVTDALLGDPIWYAELGASETVRTWFGLDHVVW